MIALEDPEVISNYVCRKGMLLVRDWRMGALVIKT